MHEQLSCANEVVWIGGLHAFSSPGLGREVERIGGLAARDESDQIVFRVRHGSQVGRPNMSVDTAWGDDVVGCPPSGLPMLGLDVKTDVKRESLSRVDLCGSRVAATLSKLRIACWCIRASMTRHAVTAYTTTSQIATHSPI